MRENHTGQLSHKADSSLNDLMLRIKRTRTNHGVDAFVAFKNKVATADDNHTKRIRND